MTFYDAFFPSYDYNPYHQQPSYGRRPQPTRNPYASVHPQPAYVHDPYHRVQKQQPQRQQHRQYQTSRNPYNGFPRQTFYQEEPDVEDYEEDEQYIHPAYSSYHNPQMARESPVERPNFPVRQADNGGVHIPIKRASSTQPNPNRNQQDTTSKQQPRSKSTKQQTKPNDVKKEAADSDKVVVDRSVLEQKDEDPLIVELPIDQIASVQFSPMSQPGSVEYIWEDEDHDDVIETIVDSPISFRRTTPLSIEASEETKTKEDEEAEFHQEEIERSPSYTSEEVEQWRKELETLSFIGFEDVNVLIPLLREHIGHPDVDIETKHKGLQNLLRRLIVH